MKLLETTRPGLAIRPRRVAAVVLLGLASTRPLEAQQVPDRDFRPVIDTPAYAPGQGPVICLDAAHHNFHTLDERFWAFGELTRRDGYATRSLRERFTGCALAGCRTLVIANAQPNDDEWDTYPSPTPPAFTPAEVEAVHAWVREGGSLLLIADHMPLAGAAANLAAAFGVSFSDGFAVANHETEAGRDSAFDTPTIFSTSDGTLQPHAIVRGRNASESVSRVRSFTGQAFQAPGAEPVLVLPSSFVSLMPAKAWQFDATTPRMAVGGWLQGAVMRLGTGRAAFFGEAAMFSAQVAGPERRPMGMNAPGAEQNFQFVLNVVHWLSGALP